MLRKTCIRCAVALIASASTNWCWGGLHYTVIPLAADGEPLWAAQDINNAGDILGFSSHQHRIIVHDSKSIPLSSDTGLRVPSTSLNDHNVVAGETELSADSGFIAATWKHGHVTVLPSPPPSGNYITSQGRAINNDGVVAGITESNGATHAARWDKGGLHTLPDSGQSFAQGINQSGDIVGIDARSDSIGQQGVAAIWHQGTRIDLSIPGADRSQANSINDSGSS